MGQSVNKVILVGRMGKDPEVRFTSGGKAVANFSLATDESYKDRQGNKVQKTEWHNLVVWGPSVEGFVQPYLHKGDLIYVEGKLQTRSWEDKQTGIKKYTTEVNVQDIRGLNVAKTEGQPAAGSKSKGQAPATAQPAIADEDIPF